MRYPVKYSRNPDPREIHKGDLVWWNEGTCVGFVEDVMEDRAVYEAWGLDEPGVAFTNLHPFEANDLKHKQLVGSVTTGATVVYPAWSLEDEAVELLSPDERSGLDSAMASARNAAAPQNRDLAICVSKTRNTDGNGWDWAFHFVDSECAVIESILLPCKR